jgi:hypothetical protein
VDAQQRLAPAGKGKIVPINTFGLVDSAFLFAQVANPPQLQISPLANAVSSLAGLGALVCFIMVVVKMFQHGQTAIGVTVIVTVFCCGLGSLIAFIYGWTKASAWRMQNLMIAYTVCFLINIGVTIWIAPQIMQVIQQAQEQAMQQQQRQGGAPVQVPPK